MTAPETLYKLIILYMLKKVNFALSNAQIWSFFDEKGYTNYFTFQQVVGELLEANLIHQETVRNVTRYEMTQEGDEALFYFKNEISEGICQDVDDFLKANRFKLRNETGIVADYYKTTNFDYCVHCVVKEGKSNLFEMNLTVPTEEQAQIMCDNWQENSQTIYAYVVKQLM